MPRKRGPSPRHTPKQQRQIAEYIAQHGVERLPEYVEPPPAPVVRVPMPKKTQKQREAIKAKSDATRARKLKETMREIRKLADQYKAKLLKR